MAAILFQVGVLVLGAVTAAEGLHDHVHDWASKRRARKEGKRSRRNDSRDGGERRANTRPDAFERDVRPYSNEPVRRSNKPPSSNFDRKPAPNPPLQIGQPNKSLDLCRPRYSGEYAASSAIGPSSALDALSREANRRHLSERRKSSYGRENLENQERERRGDLLAPISRGSHSTYGGLPSVPTPPNEYQYLPPTPGIVRNASYRELQRRDYFEFKLESGRLGLPDSPYSAQPRQNPSRNGDNPGLPLTVARQNTGLGPGNAAPQSDLSTYRPEQRRSSTYRPRSYISPEYATSTDASSSKGYTASEHAPASASQPPAYTNYERRSTGYASSAYASSTSSGSSRLR